MGREVRRVPEGFRWPIDKTWFGFVLPKVDCALCGGDGKAKADGGTSKAYWGPQDKSGSESEFCSCCEGDGFTWPQINVPRGDWWQVWETVSEGSPVTPAFATPQELAEWMATESSDRAWANCTVNEIAHWIEGAGWAPSGIMHGGRYVHGVDAMVQLNRADSKQETE